MFKTNKKSFKERSADIIGIFSQTVENLTSLNTEVLKSIEDNKSSIKKLEQELDEYITTLSANENVIDNIYKIIKPA